MAASKFTPEARGALLERFAAGLSLPDAARAVGVNAKTLKGWLTRGRAEADGDYAVFAEAVNGARQAAEDRPEPMTVEEFQAKLDEAVRAGSVQAMKLWDERERRRQEQSGARVHTKSKISSLAEARTRRAS
jgi:hypothetical protein